MDEIEIVPYRKDMDQRCMELERQCPQGKAFRLSFARDHFHKRAEDFPEWRAFVCLKGGAVAGVVAVGLKDMIVRGDPLLGAYYFDLRVHPRYRHRGIAQRLGWTAKEWALEKGAKYHYFSCIDDNRAILAIGSVVKGQKVGGYRLLAWPVYKEMEGAGKVSRSPKEEVHRKFVSLNGPFDLYSNPFQGGKLHGHVMSLSNDGAGCSVWSTEGILEERVERIPFLQSCARTAIGAFPLNLRDWPHIPKNGELIKGLYLYDLFAEDEDALRGLMHHVNNWALKQGKHYIYITDTRTPGTIDGLRKELPKVFSPVLGFCILSHTPGRLCNPYIDIRDL